MEAPVFHNLIGGTWVASTSGNTLENRNPADTRDLVGLFPASNARDIDQAVAAAQAAYPAWRLIPAPRRAEILFRAGQLLMQRKEDYARAMTREMGKILLETRGDVQEAIDSAFYMAGEGRRMYGQTTPSEMPNKFQMSIRMPLGVCGLITPWNFPIACWPSRVTPALSLLSANLPQARPPCCSVRPPWPPWACLARSLRMPPRCRRPSAPS